MQWKAFGKVEKDISRLDLDMILLSADSPESLSETVSDGEKLNDYLLSDRQMTIARAFGIALRLKDKMVARYKPRIIR